MHHSNNQSFKKYERIDDFNIFWISRYSKIDGINRYLKTESIGECLRFKKKTLIKGEITQTCTEIRRKRVRLRVSTCYSPRTKQLRQKQAPRWKSEERVRRRPLEITFCLFVFTSLIEGYQSSCLSHCEHKLPYMCFHLCSAQFRLLHSEWAFDLCVYVFTVLSVCFELQLLSRARTI